MKSQIAQEIDRFSPYQRSLIYQNIYAIELTYGCSIGCDFCAFDPMIGVRSHIPFPVLEQIAEEMGQVIHIRAANRRFRSHTLRLYDATEPLDYADNGRKYFDATALFKSKGFEVPTSTSIPKGKEELVIENLDQIGQISISHMNRDRLMPYYERLGIVLYIDVYHYHQSMIGNRAFDKPNSCQFSVNGTVEEAIAELREQDPTLPTKTRFYDLRTDGNRPHYEVQDPDTLVMWCGRKAFPPRDGKIKDRDESGVYEQGRAFGSGPPSFYHQIESPSITLDRVFGVKITPEGVFNVAIVKPSEDCKTGRIIEKVSPDDFHILKMRHIDVRSVPSRIYPWDYVK